MTEKSSDQPVTYPGIPEEIESKNIMSNRFILRYSVVGIALVCLGLFAAIRNQPDGSDVTRSGHRKTSFKHNTHNLKLARGKGRQMQAVNDYKEFKEEPEEMSYDDYSSSYFDGSSYSLSISSSFYGNNSNPPTSFSSSSDSYVDEAGAIFLEKLKQDNKEKRQKKLARKKAEKAAKMGAVKNVEVPDAAKLRLRDGKVIDEEGNMIRTLEKKPKIGKRLNFTRRSRRSVESTLQVDQQEELKERVELQQIDRQTRMRDYCRGTGNTGEDGELSDYTKGHILVIPEYRLLYCFVPKAGCSNWKRIMMVLTGQSDNVFDLTSDEVHLKSRFQYFSALSPAKQQEVLDTYFKFAFVREPMERLLSVYRNKFGDKTRYKKGTFRAFGKGIMRNFRQNATKYQKASGTGITWLEFTKFLLSPEIRKKYESASDIYRKDHWELQTRICSPCNVQYDFLGHMETIDEDVMYLLNKWKAQDAVKYLSQDAKRFTNSSDATILSRNYGLLQSSEKESLYNMYRNDYEAFGYEKPSIIFK